MANNGRLNAAQGKIKVTELSATCSNVGLAPTGGWRATLAINIQLTDAAGQVYRGAGSRLHVRVYPVRPTKAEKATGNGAKKKSSSRKRS